MRFTRNLARTQRPPDRSAAPPPAVSDKKKHLEKITAPQDVAVAEASRSAIPKNVLKDLAAIGTNAWRARVKMLDGEGKPREEMKRVYRHIEAIFEILHGMGFEIKDHTGEPFDYGSGTLDLITTQPVPGLSRERVVETIKPTIHWKGDVIQRGEVVVGTPPSNSERPTPRSRTTL